jgi:hypothetical protein
MKLLREYTEKDCGSWVHIEPGNDGDVLLELDDFVGIACPPCLLPFIGQWSRVSTVRKALEEAGLPDWPPCQGKEASPPSE